MLASALAIAAMVGCGSDSGGSPDGGGGGLIGNTTATMTLGIGGTIKSAFVCVNLPLGGGVGYSLQGNSASPCLGGSGYLIFERTDATNYAVTAGSTLDPMSASEPVEILSTTFGTITQPSGDDAVEGIPADTPVTISTQLHSTITFSFTGDDITVTAFE
jgi:hypothetical protein